MVNLEETSLSFDELEAIRLIDSEELGQVKTAKKMKISQSTLCRLLKKGRKKLAKAITNGHAIKIEGGNFKMVKPRGRGLGRGRGKGIGIGRGERGGKGRKGGFAAGPEGNCVCPKCGYKVKHETGVPCYKKKCPKCKINLTRE